MHVLADGPSDRNYEKTQTGKADLQGIQTLGPSARTCKQPPLVCFRNLTESRKSAQRTEIRNQIEILELKNVTTEIKSRREKKQKTPEDQSTESNETENQGKWVEATRDCARNTRAPGAGVLQATGSQRVRRGSGTEQQGSREREERRRSRPNI